MPCNALVWVSLRLPQDSETWVSRAWLFWVHTSCVLANQFSLDHIIWLVCLVQGENLCVNCDGCTSSLARRLSECMHQRSWPPTIPMDMQTGTLYFRSLPLTSCGCVINGGQQRSKPNYLSDSTSKARCTCPCLHINNKCVPQLRLYQLSSCSVPKLFVSTSIITWVNSLPFERAPRLQKCLLFPATGFCQMVVVKGIRLTTHFELQSYFRCNEANRKWV